MWDGKRYARAMMVTQEGTVWIMALPSGTSTQRAELVALTKALEMVEGRRLNAYMDSIPWTFHGHVPLPWSTFTESSIRNQGSSLQKERLPKTNARS